MIVLDTHAWVWWISNPELMSDKARDLVDEAAHKQAIYISSISAWEVAMLTTKGRLRLNMELADWITASEGLPFLNFIPVDNRIAIRAVSLPGAFHQDPADRIIVSTALTMNVPLITKDEKIQSYAHIEALW